MWGPWKIDLTKQVLILEKHHVCQNQGIMSSLQIQFAEKSLPKAFASAIGAIQKHQGD